jgi:hypothetical protein
MEAARMDAVEKETGGRLRLKYAGWNRYFDGGCREEGLVKSCVIAGGGMSS